MSNRMPVTARSTSLPYDGAPVGAPHSAKACATVLLVEDDEQVLKLVSQALSTLGHLVVEAGDAVSALTAVYTDPTIDWLFSDVVLPHGMNGVQLAREARAVRPGLRTLLTSARSRAEVRAMGEIPYDVTFIPKPYMMTDINAMLRWGARKTWPRDGRM